MIQHLSSTLCFLLRICVWGTLFAFASNSVSSGADQVEFLRGTILEGKLLEIRKDEKEFDFEAQVGNQTTTRTYPYSKVYAVTLDGKRFVLTPKPTVPTNAPSASSDVSAIPVRTKAEVLKLIEEAGDTPPEWFSETELNYPPTLDLNWPKKADNGWNNQKNVGQFIWDIINPNERRWHSGIKLVHHCMSLHKDEPVLVARDMNQLGSMYFMLLQDYPRAAFWFQKTKAQANKASGIHLAECYWRLGNKKMALDTMKNKTLPPLAIKLLGDMGEIADALSLAEVYSEKSAGNEAFLAAGDALRKDNQLNEAIEYYQRVLDSDTARNAEYQARFDARAKESIAAIRLFDKAEVSQVADGSYRDSSTGYNGPVEIEVKVVAGRIESLEVIGHKEKQFYAALTDTPRQIIEKQSIRDVDGTSGATITSQAIINATAKAFAQGAK